MINCFPEMYEDELFYSVLSRYRRICGLISKRSVKRDFYGIENGLIPILFPLDLNKLITALPVGSRITGEELVSKHTMFPIYTSFLSFAKSNEIFDYMLNKNNANMAIKCGLGGSKVKLNKALKFCKMCIEEDINILGESYWRRINQVPGILYCEKHKVLLQDSDIMTNDNNNDYICADDIKIENLVAVEEKGILELNLKYIESVKYLLLQNKRRLTLKDINSFYIQKLMEKGLASKNGTIYMEDFLQGFAQFYPQNYLKLMQSDYKIEDKSNWLRLFIRNNNKNRSFLRHLLLLQFLGSSPEEIFNVTQFNQVNRVIKTHNPILDLEAKRKEWLKLVDDNRNTPRCELKKIAKGLHTYIYKYDKEWYEQVTPRIKRKINKSNIDWKSKDKQYLEKVQEAVEGILNKTEKPERICASSIRRQCGLTAEMFNVKLEKTGEFIKNSTESIEEYRIRKIK